MQQLRVEAADKHGVKRRLHDGVKRRIPRGATAAKLALARGMRDEPTAAEALLWNAIRHRRVAGFKFRRQHVIAGFIADFYCAEVHLIVEVDGDSHDERASEDARRASFLAAVGVTTIRFSNDAVLNTLDSVVETIRDTCLALCETKLPSPPNGGEGWG